MFLLSRKRGRGLRTEALRFASLALAIGASERQSMKKKSTYTDEPLGSMEVVPDFLPPPAELSFREGGVKVTLAQSKKSNPKSSRSNRTSQATDAQSPTIRRSRISVPKRAVSA